MGGIVALAYLLSGCNEADGVLAKSGVQAHSYYHVDGLKPEPMTIEKLSGTWNTGCMPHPKMEGYFLKETMAIQDQSINSLVTVYADSNCTRKWFSTEEFSTFTLSDTTHEIMEIFTGVRVTPLDSIVASLFNPKEGESDERGYCRQSGWMTDETKTIVDVADCGLPRSATSSAELFSGNHLNELFVRVCNDSENCEIKYAKSENLTR